MEKKTRMWLKALLIIAGLLFFCFLAGRQTSDIDYEKEARIRQYEADESIVKLPTTLLAYGDLLTDRRMDSGEEDAEDTYVLTTDGAYPYTTSEVESSLYKNVTVYIKDGSIIEMMEDQVQKRTKLANLWVSEVEEGRIRCFFEGNGFYLPWQTEKENREQVADIVFEDGAVRDCHFKKEKLTGKLLGIGEGKLQLPEKELELSEDVKIYRLYGELEEISLQELPVGYENTDYVIENGKVCACLVTSEKAMEMIRVLLKNSNYEQRCHGHVTLSADCAYRLQYGENTEEFAPGEEIELTPDSRYYEETDRIYLTTLVNTGKWEITSIIRNRERADYRGSLEIVKTDTGLAVINELMLEEYLYGVVPSEMPASYPMESLKAQAVCARTYAYRNMQVAGLPEFGAHVDDSTAFQVYGNTEERAETTEAVKATKGEILFYGQQPADTYYYSTSCGYGTDTRAWNGSDSQTVPYLCAKSISHEGAELTAAETTSENKAEDDMKNAALILPEELREEKRFSDFICSKQKNDFECDEPWYRWQYTADKIDISEMEKRLAERYRMQPQFILTEEEDGSYVSEPPERIGMLQEMKILSRNAGGNAAELLLMGSEGTYLVQTEYNIRYLLANGTHPVLRQDGTEAAAGTLLPSAFFILETGKEDGTVIGYTVIGGGYGHGIGMSQNGAKHMALSGMKTEDILTFFYENSRIEAVY